VPSNEPFALNAIERIFLARRFMATAPAVQKPKTDTPPEPKLQMSLIGIAVLCLAALAPLLIAHMHQLWVRPHYQFFPLILIGAGVLVWSRRAELQHVEAGSSAVTIGLLVFAWLLLATAELVNSSWLAAFTALVLVLTVLQTLGLVRRLFVVWLYLWLLIPPPFGLDATLIMSLQTLTTRWSSLLLDMVGVQHVIAGHIIEVGEQRLFVAEACAGVNSLFSIIACTLFYIFLMRIHVIRACLLLLAAIGWVLVANMGRIFIIAYFREINLAEGWRHEALGFLLFAIALCLIVSTHRLLLFFTPFANTDAAAPQDATDLAPVPEVAPWMTVLNQSRLNSWIVGAAFGLLLVIHFAAYGLPKDLVVSTDELARKNVDKLKEDSMPRDLAVPRDLPSWRREKWIEEQRDMSNAFGEFSKSWVYQGEGQHASISIDYPFPAWHELSQCYNGAGWELEGITNFDNPEPGLPPHHCEQKMKKSGLRWGCLYFCQIDSKGQVLTPPRRGAIVGTIYRQQSLLSKLLARDNPKMDVVQQVGAVYQFQMFVESFAPITPAEQEKMRRRFFEAYGDINKLVFEDAAKP
jgi:exosortase